MASSAKRREWAPFSQICTGTKGADRADIDICAGIGPRCGARRDATLGAADRRRGATSHRVPTSHGCSVAATMLRLQPPPWLRRKRAVVASSDDGLWEQTTVLTPLSHEALGSERRAPRPLVLGPCNMAKQTNKQTNRAAATVLRRCLVRRRLLRNMRHTTYTIQRCDMRHATCEIKQVAMCAGCHSFRSWDRRWSLSSRSIRSHPPPLSLPRLVCTHARPRSLVQSHTHTHIQTRTHARAHTHAHTHTNTRTHTRARAQTHNHTRRHVDKTFPHARGHTRERRTRRRVRAGAHACTCRHSTHAPMQTHL
jgi:hypothetical protein